MDNITNMIEYNNYCNKLYISYITKHFEFIKFYCLIQKLLTINTQLTDDNSIVNILSILDNSNIDNSKLKKLIDQHKKFKTQIETLKNLTGDYPEIDKKNSNELDKLFERLDSGDEQCDHLKEELGGNRKQVAQLTDEIQQLQTKIDLLEKQDDLEDCNQQITVLKLELNTIQNEQSQLIDGKKVLEKKINELTKNKQDIDNTSNSTASHIDELELNKQQLMAEIKKLTQGLVECNIDSTNKLETHQKQLDNKHQKLTQLEKTHNDASNSLETEINNSKELTKQLKILETNKIELETSNTSINIELDKIKQALDTKTTQLNRTKIEIKTSLEMKSQVDILESKISNLENEKQVLNTALESYKNTNTEMGKIESQLKKCNDTLLKEKTTAQELNQEISKLKKQIMDLQQPMDKQTKIILSKNEDSLTEKRTHRDDMTNKRKVEAARVEREINERRDANISGVKNTTSANQDTLILGNKQEMKYSYDRVLSNSLSKPLNLSKINCGFSNNQERKDKSFVEAKEKRLIHLIQQSGDNGYYKIYQSLLKRYQSETTQERINKHGDSWGDLHFCKSKAIEWFCRYVKVGLIHHLLEDQEVLNQARDKINNWCKQKQTLDRQCPSPMCMEDTNTYQCRRKRTYYSNINDDTSAEIRKQLYPNEKERTQLHKL